MDCVVTQGATSMHIKTKDIFKDFPFPNKRPDLGKKLSLNIMFTLSLYSLPNYERTMDDIYVVMTKFSKISKAFVIHKKLMVNPYLIGDFNTYSFCVE